MDPIKIKFGTDGWRENIAQEYTVDNVMRVAEGTAHVLRVYAQGANATETRKMLDASRKEMGI